MFGVRAAWVHRKLQESLPDGEVLEAISRQMGMVAQLRLISKELKACTFHKALAMHEGLVFACMCVHMCVRVGDLLESIVGVLLQPACLRLLPCVSSIVARTVGGQGSGWEPRIGPNRGLQLT